MNFRSGSIANFPGDGFHFPDRGEANIQNGAKRLLTESRAPTIVDSCRSP